MSLMRLKKKALENEAVRAEYDRLASEFALIDELLTMRNSAGLTQEQVAERMGTRKSNISRLERGRGNPSWKTLTGYAKACGYDIQLTSTKQSEKRSPA